VNTPTTPQKRNYSTEKPGERASRRIVLSMTYEQYEVVMSTSKKARDSLIELMKTYPELFPAEIMQTAQTPIYFSGQTQGYEIAASTTTKSGR
jgi:hypothetical protein